MVIYIEQGGNVKLVAEAFAQRGLVVEGFLERRGAGPRDLQLYPRRMIERLNRTNGSFEKLLFGQAGFLGGRSALTLGFFACLFIRQRLAHGRQFLQGFGFQK